MKKVLLVLACGLLLTACNEPEKVQGINKPIVINQVENEVSNDEEVKEIKEEVIEEIPTVHFEDLPTEVLEETPAEEEIVETPVEEVVEEEPVVEEISYSIADKVNPNYQGHELAEDAKIFNIYADDELVLTADSLEGFNFDNELDYTIALNVSKNQMINFDKMPNVKTLTIEGSFYQTGSLNLDGYMPQLTNITFNVNEVNYDMTFVNCNVKFNSGVDFNDHNIYTYGRQCKFSAAYMTSLSVYAYTTFHTDLSVTNELFLNDFVCYSGTDAIYADTLFVNNLYLFNLSQFKMNYNFTIIDIGNIIIDSAGTGNGAASLYFNNCSADVYIDNIISENSKAYFEIKRHVDGSDNVDININRFSHKSIFILTYMASEYIEYNVITGETVNLWSGELPDIVFEACKINEIVDMGIVDINIMNEQGNYIYENGCFYVYR